MASKFSFCLRLEFLQNLASAFITALNPAIVHNLGKYLALLKVFYLSGIEDIEGDYLEFGVFQGSSFCHAIRCCRKLAKINPNLSGTKFYGFDAFAGFGPLKEEDRHPFYVGENFATSLPKVDRRVRKTGKGVVFQLIPGFFSESLRHGAQKYGIEKARIVFIDSDTFGSASQALTFSRPAIQQGTFIVLDDYFSYRGRNDRGVRRAFLEFATESRIETRHVFAYGMGGVVFVVSKVPHGAA